MKTESVPVQWLIKEEKKFIKEKSYDMKCNFTYLSCLINDYNMNKLHSNLLIYNFKYLFN